WLLGLTVILCAVLYPLVLLGVGQTALRHQADGSLLTDKDGKVLGSRLIAQGFDGDEYFQPRPSAVAYNASASGASNWGASNPLLRPRVARQLGPIVFYGPGAEKYDRTPGEPVGPDIEAWFRGNKYRGNKGIVAQWLKLYPSLAEGWVKDTGDTLKDQTGKDTPGQAFAAQWSQDFPQRYRKWKQEHPDQDDRTPGELVKPFFEGFIEDHPGAWPFLDDVSEGGRSVKKIVPIKEETDSKKRKEIQGAFFDMWRQDNPDVALEQVPADMVTASASGLDPDITLDNARYQLRHRIAAAWADKIIEERKLQVDKTRRSEIRDRIHEDIVRLLDDR